MVFVNPIDPTIPADSDTAAQGDDQIRQLKSDLAERLGQFMTGWPDTDPLMFRSVTVDLLENRPATPTEDGQLFYATDNGILYIGDAGAWITFSATAKTPPWPILSSISVPSELVVTDSSSCTDEVPTYEVDLVWVNGDVTLQTLIIINGIVVLTAATAVTTANDLTHADIDANEYVLITLMHYDSVNEQLGPPIHQLWKPPNPCTASTAVQQLANFTTVDASTTGPVYVVDIAIARNTPSQFVDIYRDGVLVYTFSPGISTWSDTGPTGVANNIYTAVPREGTTDGPPMTRAIFLPDPDAAGLTAPADLQATNISSDCDEGPPIYEVRLTWTNTEPQETRVYAREGTDGFALQATLAAGIAIFNWQGPPFVLDEEWEFRLTHWNDPTESAVSNVAAWDANCIF